MDPGTIHRGGRRVITNDTGAAFPSFYALLVGAPADVTFNQSEWNNAIFSNGTDLNPPFPDATQTTFNGPPGSGTGARPKSASASWFRMQVRRLSRWC